jgi:general secretion pathway protein K
MMMRHVNKSLARQVAHRHAQRGAALLMAMVIVTLVATLSASMVWQQWRAVQVESAERARSQAAWVLIGVLDWPRSLLRDDGRTQGAVDHMGEIWATPMAETRLSTFLAADSNNNSSDNDDAPDAFLSGRATDAQAKYNLRNLIDGGGAVQPEQLVLLKRLFEYISVAPSLADAIADGLHKAVLGALGDDPTILTQLGGPQGHAQAPLLPQTLDDLLWLGLDAGTLEKLRPYVILLPEQPTLVNVNTAPKEVIAAMVENLDLARAARLVQARQRKPFKNTPADLIEVLGQGNWKFEHLSVNSSYFEIRGRLRYEDNIIEQRNLVQRTGGEVVVRQRSQFSGLDTGVTAGATP